MVLWPGWSDPETASTALPVARPSASAWTCTFASALRETLASSRSRSRGLGSKAWTAPCAPTSFAASSVKTPALAPTSTTVIPGPMSFEIACISFGS